MSRITRSVEQSAIGPSLGAEPLAVRLGAWIAVQEDRPPSPKVCLRAEEILLDMLGCAAVGASFEQRLILADVMDEETISGNAVLIGVPSAPRCSAGRAAFLNGVASNISDADDTHVPTMLHLESAIVPALLALSSVRSVSGADAIRGIAVGYELATNLVKPEHYERGWHSSGTLGSLAAAAAVASAMRLGPKECAVALSISASLASGLRANFGSATKALHLGHASSSGLLAARLASAGFTSQPFALDGEAGFATVFGGIATDIDLLDGSPRALLETSFKPYPCGIVTHPTVEAALELGRRKGRHLEDIAEVVITVSPDTHKLACFDEPRDGLEARLSLTHCAAVGLALRSGGIDSFTNAAVLDPKIVGLRRKCRVRVDSAIGSGSALVRLKTGSGRILEHGIIAAAGTPGKPITRATLLAKFYDYFARTYDRGVADAVVELVFTLPAIEDLTRLTALLEAP